MSIDVSSALQSQAFVDAVGALPTTRPANVPADQLPALAAALAALTPLSGKANDSSATAVALGNLAAAKNTTLLVNSSEEISACAVPFPCSRPA